MYTTSSSNRPRVALAAGGTRAEAVRNALALVRSEISAAIRGSVLIKPNFLSSTNPLASTQADAVRPVLELIGECSSSSPHTIGPVVIAEGGTRSTTTAFQAFGYHELASTFGVELIDLNREPHTRQFPVITQHRAEQVISYSDRAADAGTRISVAVAKTHDFATVTGSLKNMMGCLRRIHRPRMHGAHLGPLVETVGGGLWETLDRHPLAMKTVMGMVFGTVHLNRYLHRAAHGGSQPGLQAQIRAVGENLARLGSVLAPHIAVIDAFTAMEGEGPGGGTPVRMGVAIAGTDAVACDAVMASLMGFDPLSIGFLALAQAAGIGVADLSSIDIVGENPDQHRIQVKPHSNYPVQMTWREAW